MYVKVGLLFEVEAKLTFYVEVLASEIQKEAMPQTAKGIPLPGNRTHPTLDGAKLERQLFSIRSGS